LENRRLRKESPEPPNRGADDPLSFLLTLAAVDELRLAPGDEELAGVDLRTAAWEIAEHTGEAVAFRRTLESFGLRITKRYTLAKPPEGEVENPDAKAYHLTLRVTIERLGKNTRTVAYRLDGPTGLPTEGWWYARLGMRDYFAGVGEGESVSFEPATVPEVAAKPDTNEAIRAATDIAYLGVNAQYFVAAMIPLFDDPLKTQPVLVDEPLKGHENLTNLTTRLETKEVILDDKQPTLEHEYVLGSFGPGSHGCCKACCTSFTASWGITGWRS
jgi:hypothetical protein